MNKAQAKAPGRVNLIGEHTDYNEGWVMPAAIERAVTVQGDRRPSRQVSAVAEEYGQCAAFSLDELTPPAGKPVWIDYLKGVCRALADAGYSLSGADLSIQSTIPIGAGLSSSAALELAVAAVLTALAGVEIPLPELAQICRKAENDFVGVKCGIMDQYAVALGQTGRALLLDCRSLEYSYIPLDLGERRLLIIDSRVERTLSGSAYNRRREECEAAAGKLAQLLGRPLQSLRDVSLEEIKSAQPHLPPVLYMRSRYVVEENLRVLESAAALGAGDLQAFGYFMGRSHAGLRDLYRVSCPELDLIVQAASETPGVLGARMTGAGFGGCAVALLEKGAVDDASARIRAAFSRHGWPEPRFYLTAAADGLQFGGQYT